MGLKGFEFSGFGAFELRALELQLEVLGLADFGFQVMGLRAPFVEELRAIFKYRSGPSNGFRV